MLSRLGPTRRLFPLVFGVLTLAGVAVLLIQDAFPGLFPVISHGALEAFSLALIAFAYLVYLALHRPAIAELAKGILLAVAFLFWAANQIWPNLPQAVLFDDIAIGLFVFDLFLVIAGWPPASMDSGFAETGAEAGLRERHAREGDHW